MWSLIYSVLLSSFCYAIYERIPRRGEDGDSLPVLIGVTWLWSTGHDLICPTDIRAELLKGLASFPAMS